MSTHTRYPQLPYDDPLGFGENPHLKNSEELLTTVSEIRKILLANSLRVYTDWVDFHAWNHVKVSRHFMSIKQSKYMNIMVLLSWMKITSVHSTGWQIIRGSPHIWEISGMLSQKIMRTCKLLWYASPQDSSAPVSSTIDEVEGWIISPLSHVWSPTFF